MHNPFGVPELSVHEVAEKRTGGDEFVLLDVREPLEVEAVSLDGAEVVPMSELAALQLDALPESMDDREAEVVVFCHHGVRSLQVAAWLRQQGWSNVHNMTGGIDAYAMHVDPALGRY